MPMVEIYMDMDSMKQRTMLTTKYSSFLLLWVFRLLLVNSPFIILKVNVKVNSSGSIKRLKNDSKCVQVDTSSRSETKTTQANETENSRKSLFEDIAANQTHKLFNIPGLKITEFTHKRIKFTFQPSLIYYDISQTYIFCCYLRYWELHGKWMIRKEPIPTIPLIQKVTSGEIFIDDEIDSIADVIFKIYFHLKEVSEKEIIYRRDKFERYKAGVLSDLYIDRIDEELYLTDEERAALFEKRLQIWKRMIPPKTKANKPKLRK